MLLDLFNDIVYKLLSFTFTKSNFIHQIIVYIWFQIFQRKVIQLYFDFGDTKSHSDRCINIHRFTGFFLLFALLCCGGMLVGVLIGTFLGRMFPKRYA